MADRQNKGPEDLKAQRRRALDCFLTLIREEKTDLKDIPMQLRYQIIQKYLTQHPKMDRARAWLRLV